MKIPQKDLSERFYSSVKVDKKKARRRKFYFWFSIVILVICLFVFGVIQLEFTFEDKDASALWAVLNSLMWGAYLNVLGLKFGFKDNRYRIALMIVLIVIYACFSQFLGIRITINYIPFFYNHYATNTPEAGLFFGYNLPYWGVIWLASIWTQSEV